MRPFTLAEAARAVGAEVRPDMERILVLSVEHDTRRLAAGALFFAIEGERVDGHSFVPTAFERGAAGAVVTSPIPGAGPCLVVEDTVAALGQLSRWYLGTLTADSVAVTGSVGKTTTREMIGLILDRVGAAVVAESNFNTEIGVPQTVFRAGDGTDFVVLEFAMRGAGQIRQLAEAAPVRVGAITNIGVTHSELVGGRHQVAAAKAEMLPLLPANGVAVLPAEDDFFEFLAGQASCPVLSFGHARGDVQIRYGAGGRGANADVPITLVVEGEEHSGSLRCVGDHYAQDAACAAAVARAMGVSPQAILRGLARFEPLPGRGRIVRSPAGLVVIDDTYNACPDSMVAALRVLAGRPGRRFAVLGDMLELGAFSEEGHRQVGTEVARLGIDELVAVGERAGGIIEGAVAAGFDAVRAFNVGDAPAALEYVRQLVAPSDSVLVKASRGMRTEAIVEGLMEG